MVTVVSPVAGLMVSVANASPSGAVLSEECSASGQVCVWSRCVCVPSPLDSRAGWLWLLFKATRDNSSDCRDDMLQTAIPRAHFKFKDVNGSC